MVNIEKNEKTVILRRAKDDLGPLRLKPFISHGLNPA